MNSPAYAIIGPNGNVQQWSAAPGNAGAVAKISADGAEESGVSND